jgi:hypothetical protein
MAENIGMFSTERTSERILVSDVFERKDQREPRPDLGFVQEAARQIPVYHQCDVLVVGGGLQAQPQRWPQPGLAPVWHS